MCEARQHHTPRRCSSVLSLPVFLWQLCSPACCLKLKVHLTSASWEKKVEMNRLHAFNRSSKLLHVRPVPSTRQACFSDRTTSSALIDRITSPHLPSSSRSPPRCPQSNYSSGEEKKKNQTRLVNAPIKKKHHFKSGPSTLQKYRRITARHLLRKRCSNLTPPPTHDHTPTVVLNVSRLSLVDQAAPS